MPSRERGGDRWERGGVSGEGRHLKKQERCSVVGVQMGRSTCLDPGMFQEGFQDAGSGVRERPVR